MMPRRKVTVTINKISFFGCCDYLYIFLGKFLRLLYFQFKFLRKIKIINLNVIGWFAKNDAHRLPGEDSRDGFYRWL